MPAKQLELRNVCIRYGSLKAASDVSLALEQGEIGCLLGPSGCGKSTVLRAIAGFEQPSSGEIRLHGEVISNASASLPPEQRQVGMVFQDFALFPHLDVQANVSFGLRKLGRDQRRQRTREMLQLIGLEAQARRYPHELSGGQQQRVALARALAPEPQILLLDEPFSSLDGQLREALAGEVRQLLKASRVTAILVTHDQQEAFTVADRVSLLREGKVLQTGTPEELYQQPANEFVARFLGPGAVIEASGELAAAMGIASGDGGQPAPRVLVRPEALQPEPGSKLRATITARTFKGAQTRYELRFAEGQAALCLVPGNSEFAVGDILPVAFQRERLVILAR